MVRKVLQVTIRLLGYFHKKQACARIAQEFKKMRESTLWGANKI
jgi:hypothetical protein